MFRPRPYSYFERDARPCGFNQVTNPSQRTPWEVSPVGSENGRGLTVPSRRALHLPDLHELRYSTGGVGLSGELVTGRSSIG